MRTLVDPAADTLWDAVVITSTLEGLTEQQPEDQITEEEPEEPITEQDPDEELSNMVCGPQPNEGAATRPMPKIVPPDPGRGANVKS